MNQDTIDGVLLVDKDKDMTSHDVVAVARRTLKTKKIGHCGTLDPMATGLLILVIGRATKLSELLMAEDKEYTGALTLGQTTDTQDAEGQVLEEKEVREFSEEEIRQVFGKFQGDFYQTPPMVSAIKMGGVPLYKLARQGKEVPREPRFVHVYSHRIDKIELPRVEFTVRCTKGFYVRTYAHDIGQELGCGAHLSQLRRTKSGRFNLEGAVSFQELKHGNQNEIVAKMLSLPEVSKIRGA